VAGKALAREAAVRPPHGVGSGPAAGPAAAIGAAAGNGAGLSPLQSPAVVSIDQLRTAVDALSLARREPSWLTDIRRQALETYASMPLPDRVAHLWRYTDPERFVPAFPLQEEGRESGREIGSSGGPGNRSEWPEELGESIASGSLAGAALVVGGRIAKHSIDPALAKAGVAIEDLHHAAQKRPEVVHRALGSAVLTSAGKFEALNAALWRGGVLVHVPRGVAVEKPIHILNSCSGARSRYPRLLVVAEPGSSVAVIDEYSGDGRQVNSVVETLGASGSHVRYVFIQRLGEAGILHAAQRARIERDAKLVSVCASLGALVSKADIGTSLEGKGSEVEFLGLLFGTGRQQFDHHTVHEHISGSTLSNLDFKVVLKDRSRSAYTGLIRIAPDAPGSEAYQENRNLLLNDGAKAESIPELEILTDEVMCTHGATMGTLDPEHIFYLSSRGIPRREAARMIVAGFLEPTLVRLPADLRDRLRRYIHGALASL